MAKNNGEKKSKWTIKKEKEELTQKLKKLRERHEKLKDQKDILYEMLEKAISNNDSQRIDYLRSELVDIKGEIKDVIDEYNNAVDVLNGLEQADTTRNTKWTNWFNVGGGILIGAAGLGLTHRDAIKGFLKDKNAEMFFQTAWRSLFGRKS